MSQGFGFNGDSKKKKIFSNRRAKKRTAITDPVNKDTVYTTSGNEPGPVNETIYITSEDDEYEHGNGGGTRRQTQNRTDKLTPVYISDDDDDKGSVNTSYKHLVEYSDDEESIDISEQNEDNDCIYIYVQINDDDEDCQKHKQEKKKKNKKEKTMEKTCKKKQVEPKEENESSPKHRGEKKPSNTTRRKEKEEIAALPPPHPTSQGALYQTVDNFDELWDDYQKKKYTIFQTIHHYHGTYDILLKSDQLKRLANPSPSPEAYLDDETINGFIDLVVMTYSDPTTLVANSFWLLKILRSSNPSTFGTILRRGMLSKDAKLHTKRSSDKYPSQMQRLLIPQNDIDSHWRLLEYTIGNDTLTIYDSLNNRNSDELVLGIHNLRQWAAKTVNMPPIANLAFGTTIKQSNGCDCGVYILLNILGLVATGHVPINADILDALNLRKAIARSLYHGELDPKLLKVVSNIDQRVTPIHLKPQQGEDKSIPSTYFHETDAAVYDSDEYNDYLNRFGNLIDSEYLAKFGDWIDSE
jgi:Ulp1 family protease